MVACMPALYAFSQRFCRKRNDADDLVQETLIKALANLHQVKDVGQVKSWLFTIMRNTFCTRFKIARREAPAQYDGDTQSFPAPQEWRVQVRELQLAIGKLPANQRDVVELIVLEGESYERAAQRLGCTIGTVKSRLNRARAHLAADLGIVKEAATDPKRVERKTARDRSGIPVVLIVEDEYLMGADLANLVKRNGASVLGPASTIPSALALVSKTKKIDAAVLDVNIQNEMVFEVADVLGKRGVPFLFTSAYDFSVVPERFRKIRQYQKPIDYDDFVRNLAGLIVA
ncbi:MULTISPECIES: sigma-70 family RNA polymerase sigma factor [unclassified Sinorhizobium]|uniref:sigma-70 family RNA polymerase sigma factor n=1 Tax=unclassified Sinorhizobium TaxID=2613772 RepID=UPI00352568D5